MVYYSSAISSPACEVHSRMIVCLLFVKYTSSNWTSLTLQPKPKCNYPCPVEAAGGQALPCIVDVRDEKSVSDSLEQAVGLFGGIDIVVNNASAISLTGGCVLLYALSCFNLLFTKHRLVCILLFGRYPWLVYF